MSYLKIINVLGVFCFLFFYFNFVVHGCVFYIYFYNLFYMTSLSPDIRPLYDT